MFHLRIGRLTPEDLFPVEVDEEPLTPLELEWQRADPGHIDQGARLVRALSRRQGTAAESASGPSRGRSRTPQRDGAASLAVPAQDAHHHADDSVPDRSDDIEEELDTARFEMDEFRACLADRIPTQASAELTEKHQPSAFRKTKATRNL